MPPLVPYVLALMVSAFAAVAAPVEIAGPQFSGAMQPQAAVGKAGEIHVVFGIKDGVIFHTVSTDEARTFRAPVKIGTLPKLAVGMRRGPRIVAAGAKLVVTAISHEQGDLLAWSSSDGGKQWTGPVKVNDAPKSAREGLHAMAGTGGSVAVAWLDLRGGSMELWGATSKDGGTSWGPNARIYQSPDGPICQCCAPSLAFGPGGELAAMWRDSLAGARDMRMALSRDGGQTFGPAEKLGTGTWKLNACPMDGGGITFLRDNPGKFLTVWRREGTLYSALAGAPEQALGEGRDAVIAASTRAPVMAWQTKAGLALKACGEPLRVLDPKGSAASLAAAPDGRFVVIVWESRSKTEPALMAEILR